MLKLGARFVKLPVNGDLRSICIARSIMSLNNVQVSNQRGVLKIKLGLNVMKDCSF